MNQPDATVSQVYYLMFMYGSTCFGRPHAHHQKLNCNSSLCFYRWRVVVAVLLVVVGPAGVYRVDFVRHTVPDNVHQIHVKQPSTYEKPEAASAVLGS